jgi:hypothetical protein
MSDLSHSFRCASDKVGRTRTHVRSFCLSWSACFREAQLKTCNRFTHIRSVSYVCLSDWSSHMQSYFSRSEACQYKHNFATRRPVRKCFNVSYRCDMNTIMTMPWPVWLKIWTSIASAVAPQKVARACDPPHPRVSHVQHCPTGPVTNLHKHLETRQVGTETDPVRRLSAV